jgi:hypothetical protein
MTKIFKYIGVPIIIILCSITIGQAQAAFEAGIRIGNDFDFSIDATFPLSKAPRLHTAFYVDDGFALGTYFDWMFSLDGGPKGLKFFPGVGPEFYFGDPFDVGIAGDFGVEYSFDFPLTIGLDYRPSFIITDGFRRETGNWGVTARFRFIRAG